jgi:hypothetical protein
MIGKPHFWKLTSRQSVHRQKSILKPVLLGVGGLLTIFEQAERGIVRLSLHRNHGAYGVAKPTDDRYSGPAYP